MIGGGVTSLSETLAHVTTLDPSAPMLEFDGEWLTRGQFRQSVVAIDAALHSLGIGQSFRIGVLLSNRPGPLAAMIAVLSTERCLVAINAMLPAPKLVADIDRLAIPVAIAQIEDLEKDGVTAAFAPAGTHLVIIGPLGEVEAVHRADDRRPEIEPTAPGIMIEMLTSGTTGTPKRISLTAAAFDRSFASALSYEKGRSAGDAPQVRDGTRLLSNPIAHIGGLWGAVAAIAGGWRICLLERFSVDAWRGAVARHRLKVAAAVPAALRMILDANIQATDLESLVAIRTGTAPLDPAIVQEFLDRYDLPVLQTYGATEFAGAVAGWTLKDFRANYERKSGSVGRLQPGVSARTVDPVTQEPLADGEEGLLQLRSSQLANPESWVTTTDRAVVDGDRYLWIKGRADNAIIRGGFKVHPDDVVTALQSHPDVREASVVGLADARLGEVPAAAIVPREHATDLTPAGLITHLRTLLMAYQVPTTFLIVDDLPRTASMKPDLAAVRQLFQQEEAPGTVEA